jgi:predicted Rossmann fold nucleotide-binding protein DprA/Smf involved in DNA uptake
VRVERLPGVRVERLPGVRVERLPGVRVERLPAAAARQGPGLSPLAAEALAALAEGPADRDALARRLARAPSALAAALLELELAERVAEDRDGRLRALGDPFPGA